MFSPHGWPCGHSRLLARWRLCAARSQPLALAFYCLCVPTKHRGCAALRHFSFLLPLLPLLLRRVRGCAGAGAAAAVGAQAVLGDHGAAAAVDNAAEHVPAVLHRADPGRQLRGRGAARSRVVHPAARGALPPLPGNNKKRKEKKRRRRRRRRGRLWSSLGVRSCSWEFL